MDLIVKPSATRGAMTVPSSKSHSLRAVLFGTLASGTTVVEGLLDSPDTRAMISACRLLGAKIVEKDGHCEIEGLSGKIDGAEDVIDAGNSGLVLRMVAGIAALSPRPIVITGDASIRHNRRMDAMLQALQQLGVRAESTRGNGYAPVIIQGPFQGGSATLSGHDSQPVSALLMAAALAPNATELTVENPGEQPWIDLTLHWLQMLGLSCSHQNYRHYTVPGRERIEAFDYQVPGDLSSLAFPVVAAAVTGSGLTVQNIDLSDPQGDKRVIDILRQMGVEIVVDRDLTVSAGAQLQGIEIDVNSCIDAVPILAVAACYAEGQTTIRNGAVAREKECDRIACVARELRKMGADVDEHPDGLTIRGKPLQGAEVYSHHDHRMAMALAVAGLAASGTTHVRDVACVNKTFPQFARKMQEIGLKMEEVS